MTKSKFGDAVRSKKEVAEINEVLLKVLCHNICGSFKRCLNWELRQIFFTPFRFK